MNEINPDTLREARAELEQVVARARQVITSPELLEKKWLRPRSNLFGNYFDKFVAINPPRGGAILDLGCGPGYLMWMCRRLAECDIHGLEVRTREDLRVLWQELKLEPTVRIGRILAHRSLQLDRKYDVISATHICFDRVDDEPWDFEAYRFFLEDVGRHLTPNGFLYLLFNYPLDPGIVTAMAKFGTWESNLVFRMASRDAPGEAHVPVADSRTTV